MPGTSSGLRLFSALFACVALANCAVVSGLDAFRLSDGEGEMGGAGVGSSSGTAGGGGNGGGCSHCDDENECTADSCGANGECAHTPLPIGTVCKEGVCGSTGTCVPCASDAECATGHCVDAVCCATPCDGVCVSCAVPGLEGACTPLPEGMTDAGQCEETTGCTPASGETCVCDGATPPICTATDDEPLGGNCLFNSDCHNGTCSLGLCRLENGQPCFDNVACGSNRCFENRCQACSQNADCLSGVCDSSSAECKAALGEPCGDDADCVAGECTDDALCKIANGSCSADVECATGFCDTTCMICGGASDCASGVCTSGACGVPAGEYCVADISCASGNCQGFPGRCM